jgi:hypothetical protein
MGLAVTALIALIYAGFVFTKRFKPDVLSAYYALILLGLAAIALSGVAIPPEYLVGAVILYHYASWYVHYYVRFAPKPERQRGYLIDMLSVNALIIAAYALYLYVPQLWPLSYAFLPIYFYIWTILHIASSVRFDDYRSMLRF